MNRNFFNKEFKYENNDFTKEAILMRHHVLGLEAKKQLSELERINNQFWISNYIFSLLTRVKKIKKLKKKRSLLLVYLTSGIE